MNPEQHNANVGLPSFQSFFHGQNGMNRPHPHESHMLNRPHQAEIHAMNRHGHGPVQTENHNFYFDTAQSSTALDLSCTESKPKPCTAGLNERSDKQSLYYKECLPSFANFMNYPQMQSNNGDHLEMKSENTTYESCQRNSTAAQNSDNFYSHKLNEMSQMWKDPLKTEEPPTSNHGSYYPNNMASHPMYSQYNPYQFMNNMPPTSASMNFLQYYNHQQPNSYQQYGMYPNVKSEEFYGKSYQNPQLSLGEDENEYEDLDSMILKRRKPSSTSKRAKKMRGDVEDCDYELCNMWDEVAIPSNSGGKCVKTSGKDKGDHKELIKTESNSCDSENYNSNDTLSSNSTKDATPDLLKPVTIFNFIADESINAKCRLFLEAERRLCQHLKMISFGEPVSHIYNPLVYAFETHLKFLKTFCTSDKTVLFLAMNPGPFGMSQNGVSISNNGCILRYILH